MWLATMLAGATPSGAETLYLKNGRTVRGQITQRTEDFVAIRSADGVTTYVVDEIERMEEGGDARVETPSPVETGPDAPALPVTTASDAADAPRARVEQVLELGGVGWQLAQIEAQMEAHLARRERAMSPEAAAKLHEALAESFRADRLNAVVVTTFLRAYDEERLSDVAQWLQGPLMSRVLETQRHVQAASDAAALDAFAKTAPPPNRLALAERFEQATGSTETVLRTTDTILQLAAKATQPLSSEDVDRELAKLRAQFTAQYRDQIRSAIVVHFLFVYQALSDEELEQYVAFAESDTGRWYQRLVSDAVVQALAEGLAQFMSRLTGERSTFRASESSPASSSAPATEGASSIFDKMRKDTGNSSPDVLDAASSRSLQRRGENANPPGPDPGAPHREGWGDDAR